MQDKFVGVSVFEFMERFRDEESCRKYLYDLKFSKGFVCSKCSHTEAYKGIKPYTHVCKECRHIESATSNTVFHRVKFGLRKAFAIVFEVTTTAKGISALQVSHRYSINYDTAWLFVKKVRAAMKSSGNHPMVGKVYVDEFVFGGHEPGAQGRKKNSKKIKAVMAVEVTNQNRVKRVYSIKINDYSTEVEVPVILTTACRFKLTTSCRSKLTTLCRLKLTT